jgi:DNA-binding beta-propeller fold protein YncE
MATLLESLILALFVSLVGQALVAQPGSAPPALRRVAVIHLPGPKGKRFDYLTIDQPDRYLLSAYLGAGLLYVIDMQTNTVVHTIPGVPGVEGVVYVPELHKAYTSDWLDSSIGVVDLRQMKVVKKLPTAAKPDGSAYAAPFHKVFVSDERGKALAIVDVQTDQIVKTLHFASETGMPRYDPAARRVYVNLQDQNLFAEIDPASGTVIAQYPVAGCRSNHGMALDFEHHLAFLSCEGNNTMTVFDLQRHKAIAWLPMADGPDVIKYDPGLQRIYVACYSGAISIFHEDSPDHFRKIEDFRVQPKVHSLAVDPRTHRVYTPEQQVNGQPAAEMVVYDAVQ